MCVYIYINIYMNHMFSTRTQSVPYISTKIMILCLYFRWRSRRCGGGCATATSLWTSLSIYAKFRMSIYLKHGYIYIYI